MYAFVPDISTPIFDGLKVVIEAVLRPLGEFIDTIRKATYNVYGHFGDPSRASLARFSGSLRGTGGSRWRRSSPYLVALGRDLENMTKLASAIRTPGGCKRRPNYSEG